MPLTATEQAFIARWRSWPSRARIVLFDPTGTIMPSTVETVDDAIRFLAVINDALVFKGVIDCSTDPDYPAADAGHTYRVSADGHIGGASGPAVILGDLLTCIVDGTPSGDHAAVGASWAITPQNIDGTVIGPVSAVSGNLVEFDGTTGKVVSDSGIASAAVSAHLASTANPHGTTKAQVGLSNVNNVAQLPLSYLDDDEALAADSATRVPSQRAVKAYVDANTDGGALRWVSMTVYDGSNFLPLVDSDGNQLMAEV